MEVLEVHAKQQSYFIILTVTWCDSSQITDQESEGSAFFTQLQETKARYGSQRGFMTLIFSGRAIYQSMSNPREFWSVMVTAT